MFSREDNSFMEMNNQNQFMNVFALLSFNGCISAQPKGTVQNPIHEDNDILKQRANAFFSDKSTSQLNRKASLSQLNPDEPSAAISSPNLQNIDQYLKSQYDQLVNSTIDEAKDLLNTQDRLLFDEYMCSNFKTLKNSVAKVLMENNIKNISPAPINIKHELVNPRFSKIHHKKNPKTVNLSNYASVLKELSKNQPRNAGNVMNSNTKLIEEFQRIDFKSKNEMLNYCWKLIYNQIFGKHNIFQQKDRQMNILHNTVDFFQKNYLNEITEQVKQSGTNLPKSSFSGNTSKPIIEAYSKILAKQYPEESFDCSRNGKQYFWIELYIAIRCGLTWKDLQSYNTSIKEVLSADEYNDFESFLKLFVSIRDGEKTDIKMNPSAFRKITTHFNKYINLYKSKYPQDKFKIAIYSIITNQDPYNFPFSETFFPTIQDYIWYSLVNVLYSTTIAVPCQTPCYTLSNAIDDITKAGLDHFNPTGDQPLIPAIVLLLLQNYNDAVRYLIYSNEYTLALNMALILAYYNLINSASYADVLCDILQSIRTEDQLTLLYYIQRLTDDQDLERTLIYYLLTVSKLDTVLGVIQSNGLRTHGFLDQLLTNQPHYAIDHQSFMGSNDKVTIILQHAVSKATMNHAIDKAALLACYCGEFSYALQLYTKQLAQTCYINNPEREEWYNKSTTFYKNYIENKPYINNSNFTTYKMFDAIENAYHYFFQNNYEDALSYFVKVDVLPQPTGQGSYDSIQKALNLAQSLESDILVHIPYIVRDYLLCLHKRFCFLNGPKSNDGAINNVREQVRYLSFFIRNLNVPVTDEVNLRVVDLISEMS